MKNFTVFYTGGVFDEDDPDEINTYDFETITEAREFYHFIQVFYDSADPEIRNNNTGEVFRNGRWI